MFIILLYFVHLDSTFFRPSVHFSSDETVACRLATNEIQFFDPRDFSKGFVNRLRVPGIAALELSKAPGSYVAAFVPESKVHFAVQEENCWILINNEFKTSMYYHFDMLADSITNPYFAYC